jgi:protein TonB
MCERNGSVVREAIEAPKLSHPGMRKAAELQPRRIKPAVTANLSAGMLENNRMKRPRGVIDFLVSVAGHSLLLAAAILIPLCFTNAFDLQQLKTTYLVAPLLPPPPPAPAETVHSIQRPRTILIEHVLYAPRVMPKSIAQVKDLPSTPQISVGVPGGVIGGVPGGQLGGVIGGILGNSTRVVPPPPPPLPRHVAPHGPYRVGGVVQAPQLVYQVQPMYPPLAKEIHVQGDVLIDSVIDAQGNVTQMKVVSGQPLLITAAIDALRQWRYSPTLLNGVPVTVEMEVTVKFRLS